MSGHLRWTIYGAHNQGLRFFCLIWQATISALDLKLNSSLTSLLPHAIKTPPYPSSLPFLYTVHPSGKTSDEDIDEVSQDSLPAMISGE